MLASAPDFTLLHFPSEILHQIFGALSVKDFVNLSLSCAQLYKECQDEQLWFRICLTNFPDHFELFGELPKDYERDCKPPDQNWKWLAKAKMATISAEGEGSRLGTAVKKTGSEITETYSGQMVGDKQEGWGILKKRTSYYFGEFKDSKYFGFGTFVYLNAGKKSTYRGQWSEKQNGFGKLKSFDGGIYEGTFKEGLFDGKGLYKWKNGDVYDGEWKGNLKDGYGTYTWANGDFFQGTWSADLREGKGYFRSVVCGSEYDGDYVSGKMHGKGTYKWYSASGKLLATFTGDWKDGNQHGQGRAVCSNGIVHEGAFEKDLRNGPGQLYFPDGSKFVGNWKHGGRFGRGTYYDIGGKTHTQLWNEGEVSYARSMPDKFPPV